MTTELPLERKYAEVLAALLYTLDCNLATVDDLFMKKSASMNELKRQVNITQHAVNIFTACWVFS
jgi:hypothetical protein